MKRIIAMTFAVALLLTGCGQVDEKVGKEIQSADTQITDNNEKAVTEIKITEIGGEDGRDNEWIISQVGDYNVVVQKDNRFDKTTTYHISNEDYQILMDIDFSPFIDKTEDSDGVVDWVFYTIKIVYNDTTEDKIEVYIPELWNKIYSIIAEYEPVDNITNDEPFPESGNIGKYTYKTINSKGHFEADFSGAGKYDKCFYLEKDIRPDFPLQIYIYGGEYSHGGYFMDVTDLKIENDTLYITVNEGLVEAEVYTEALMTTGCMVEISPNVSNVIVKNTGGYEFKQIENSPKPCESTNNTTFQVIEKIK